MRVMYRYEIEYKNPDNDATDLRLRELRVVDETEKTLVVEDWSRRRRVLKDSLNGYAHLTKEDALDHLIRRTRKRISWYEFWTEECNNALKLAEELKQAS